MHSWRVLSFLLFTCTNFQAQDSGKFALPEKRYLHELGVGLAKLDGCMHYGQYAYPQKLNLQHPAFYRVTKGRWGLRCEVRYATKNKTTANDMFLLRDTIISFDSKDLQVGIGFQYVPFSSFKFAYLLTDVNYRTAKCSGYSKNDAVKPSHLQFNGVLRGLGISSGLGMRAVFFKKFVLSTEFVGKLIYTKTVLSGHDFNYVRNFSITSSCIKLVPELRLYLTLAL